jgi:8-amino-7-oxononanoate synthase
VFGPNGRGLAYFLEGAPNIITLHTCGKALGISGALLCLSIYFKQFLVNRARNFIFATAPSPLVAACIREVLKYSSKNDDRRIQLFSHIEHTKRCLSFLSHPGPTNSQIQPIIIGSDARALSIAEKLNSQGYDIRAIRPPTVPEGSARLRLSVTLNVTENQISQMSSYMYDLIQKEK